MFETTVTVIGRLITPLKQLRFTDGTLKVSGRMACTERRYDRTAGQWVDGQTLYVSVVCRRGLAENAFSSLRVGDPVVAHGRLYTREYEKDGVQNTVTELEAWSLGPDLQWCTAVLTKKSRAAQQSADRAEERDAGPAGVDAGADRPVPSELPVDDPWSEPVPAETRVGEAAVGV